MLLERQRGINHSDRDSKQDLLHEVMEPALSHRTSRAWAAALCLFLRETTQIPMDTAGAKRGLESSLSSCSLQITCCPSDTSLMGRELCFCQSCAEDAAGRGGGGLVLHVSAFASAEQEARKGATKMNKTWVLFFLVAHSPLSGFRTASGCVGKKQWQWEKLSSTSDYGLSAQGLSLAHGFQIILFIFQNTC